MEGKGGRTEGERGMGIYSTWALTSLFWGNQSAYTMFLWVLDLLDLGHAWAVDGPWMGHGPGMGQAWATSRLDALAFPRYNI